MIPQSYFVSMVYTQACAQALQCSSWQASERPGDMKDIYANHSANDKATEKVCVRELGASSHEYGKIPQRVKIAVAGVWRAR